MKENWQQENLEKTKKVLMEHFKRKKEEEMFKEMLREAMLFSTPTQFHIGTGWDIEDSEFDKKIKKIGDDFNNDFKKDVIKFNDDFIWGDLTDSNNKKDKKNEMSENNEMSKL